LLIFNLTDFAFFCQCHDSAHAVAAVSGFHGHGLRLQAARIPPDQLIGKLIGKSIFPMLHFEDNYLKYQ